MIFHSAIRWMFGVRSSWHRIRQNEGPKARTIIARVEGPDTFRRLSASPVRALQNPPKRPIPFTSIWPPPSLSQFDTYAITNPEMEGERDQWERQRSKAPERRVPLGLLHSLNFGENIIICGAIACDC